MERNFCFIKYQAQYNCRECLFSTQNLVELKNHSENRKEDESPIFIEHECKVCEFKTYSQFIYLVHLEREKGEGRPHIPESVGDENFQKGHKSDLTKQKPHHPIIENGIKYKQCKYCEHKTRTRNGMFRHIRCHHSQNLFTCGLCSKKYNSKDHLCDHLISIHAPYYLKHKPFKCSKCDFKQKMYHTIIENGIKYKQCTFCEHKTMTRNGMLYHIRRHHNSKLFNCGYCSKKCNSKDHLRKHIITNHIPDDLINCFKCDLCNINFKTKRILNDHLAQGMCKGRTSKCPKCEFTTTAENFLKRHFLEKHRSDWTISKQKIYRTVIENGIEYSQCTYCEHKTRTRTGKFHHIRRHSNSNLVTCGHCARMFANKTKLREHIISRHTPDDRINWFKCDQCDYKAKFKHRLNHHIRRHNSSMAFKCEHCEKTFASKRYLKYHVNVNHTPDYQIEWRYCDQCHFKSKNKNYVRHHIKTKHSEFKVLKRKMKTIQTHKTKRKMKTLQTYKTYRKFEYLSKTNKELTQHRQSSHQKMNLSIKHDHNYSSIHLDYNGAENEHQPRRNDYNVVENKHQSNRPNRTNSKQKMYRTIIENGIEYKQCTYCEHKTNTESFMFSHIIQHHNTTLLTCSPWSRPYSRREHQSTKNDNIVVENEYESRKNDNIVVENEYESRKNDNKVVENEHRSRKNYNIVVENEYESSKNDNNVVENDHQPRKNNVLDPKCDRDHQCEHCGMKFEKNEHLQKTCKYNPDDDEFKPFLCDKCEFKAKIKSQFRQNVMTDGLQKLKISCNKI